MAFKWLRQKQEHSKTPPFDILGGLSTHKKQILAKALLRNWS